MCLLSSKLYNKEVREKREVCNLIFSFYRFIEKGSFFGNDLYDRLNFIDKICFFLIFVNRVLIEIVYCSVLWVGLCFYCVVDYNDLYIFYRKNRIRVKVSFVI